MTAEGADLQITANVAVTCAGAVARRVASVHSPSRLGSHAFEDCRARAGKAAELATCGRTPRSSAAGHARTAANGTNGDQQTGWTTAQRSACLLAHEPREPRSACSGAAGRPR